MPIPRSVSGLRRGLLRDDVYLRLRDAIVDGTFEPGEQLRDVELADWLGVSRTPVREALLRLGQAGLVQAAPGRSTRVSPLDAQAIRDAQAVVGAMHRLAVEEAFLALTSEDLAEMRRANARFAAALEAGDVDTAMSADDDFHDVPVRVAGNQVIILVLEQFGPIVRRLERQRFASGGGDISVALHGRLLDLCEAGDVHGAGAVSHETWQSLEPLLDAP